MLKEGLLSHVFTKLQMRKYYIKCNTKLLITISIQWIFAHVSAIFFRNKVFLREWLFFLIVINNEIMKPSAELVVPISLPLNGSIEPLTTYSEPKFIFISQN